MNKIFLLLGFIGITLFFAQISCAQEGVPEVGCFIWAEGYNEVPLSGKLTPKLFYGKQFAVASYAFPQITEKGYPIRFLKNGKVESTNLLGIEKWRIKDSDSLELLSSEGQLLYTFEYNKICKSLRTPDVRVPTEIIAIKNGY